MHGSAPEDRLFQPQERMIHVPDVIPIFPLPRVVLLPGEVLPLHVFELRYTDLVRDAIASHRVIGMVEVMPGFEDDLPTSRRSAWRGFSTCARSCGRSFPDSWTSTAHHASNSHDTWARSATPS